MDPPAARLVRTSRPADARRLWGGDGSDALTAGAPPLLTLTAGPVERLAPDDFPRLLLDDSNARIALADEDSLELGSVTSLAAVGDRLVIGDPYRSPHLSVHDLATGRLLHRFGREGEGPGEFRVPVWMEASAASPFEFRVYDFQRYALSLVRLAPDRPPLVEATVRLSSPGYVLEPTVGPDGRILTNGLYPDHTLSELDAEGRLLRNVVVRPRPFPEAEVARPVARMLLNRTHLGRRPGGRSLVLAYQYAPILDFVELENRTARRLETPGATRATYRIDERGRLLFRPGSERAYVSVGASERHVYALFCGPCSDDRPARRIHVFTWRGEPVAELVSPVGGVRMAVDRRGGTLLLATVDPVPRVHRIELAGLFDEERAVESTAGSRAGPREEGSEEMGSGAVGQRRQERRLPRRWASTRDARGNPKRKEKDHVEPDEDPERSEDDGRGARPGTAGRGDAAGPERGRWGGRARDGRRACARCAGRGEPGVWPECGMRTGPQRSVLCEHRRRLCDRQPPPFEWSPVRRMH